MKRIILVFISVLLFLLVWLVINSQVNTKTFVWTSSGDDGMVGQASYSELGYALTSDSLVNFWADVNKIPGPVPSGPSQLDSVIVDIGILLPDTTYYFAVKLADEVFNWSDVSNIVIVNTQDTRPPSSIVDFLVR